jgi:lupus La protein
VQLFADSSKVEFYFSTQNLVTDEHLFKELGGPRNYPVPVKHISQFKRMRRFQPYSAVVKALRESKDLVVVDEGEFSGAGNEAVRRKDPLDVPTEDGDDDKRPTIQELFSRLKNTSSNKLETSVYVKGFGNPDDAGQIALEKFFRPYGSVMVRKRREDDGTWKGSVFVVFDTEDSQKQFLGLDPKPKYNDNELTIMGKKEYNLMKCEQKGIEPDPQGANGRSNGNRSRGGDRDRDGGRGGARGRGRGRGGRGGRGGDRRDNRDNHARRDRSNDRSPRQRRDRSASGDSVDSRDWNNRRDRFQKGKNDRGNRKEEDRKEIERDAHGVPVVKDTRTDAEIAVKNKRKADEEKRADSPKKSKLEIKQDE